MNLNNKMNGGMVMFVNETLLIKLLTAAKKSDQIKVEVLENGTLNVSNGYFIAHVNESYYKLIAFLRKEGILDALMQPLKNTAKLQSLSDGFETDKEAKITEFVMENDTDKPKNRRKNFRIFKIDGKNKAYNEDFIQVFSTPMANEHQLTYKASADGYSLTVYYSDIKIGAVIGVRHHTLDEDIKKLVS